MKKLLFVLTLLGSITLNACGPADDESVAQSSEASYVTPVCYGAYYCVKPDGTNAYWYVYGTYNTTARQAATCQSAITSGYCVPPSGSTGCAYDRNKFPPLPRPCMLK